jgi:hypothetical protein
MVEGGGGCIDEEGCIASELKGPRLSEPKSSLNVQTTNSESEMADED